MSVQDVIKDSFVKQLGMTDVTPERAAVMLLVTAVIGAYVFLVYRVSTRKAFYSKSFAISLVVIAMITSAIILTIQASVVVSLGMVGALSIVRFRTAIKDPMDLAFLFWAISVGIICGAGLYIPAAICSLMISAVMLLLHFIPNARPTLVLMINMNSCSKEDQISEILSSRCTYFSVKSRNVTDDSMDMVIELNTRDQQELIKAISEPDFVKNAILMTSDGEITV